MRYVGAESEENLATHLVVEQEDELLFDLAAIHRQIIGNSSVFGLCSVSLESLALLERCLGSYEV